MLSPSSDILEIEELETDILTHQAEFLESEAKHTGLIAGFGAGKSKAATIKVIEKLEGFYRDTLEVLEAAGKGGNGVPKNKLINVAYYLPTYSLIRDIAYPNFEEALNDFGIPYTLNKSDKEFITPFGKIIMRSMDNPELIVGYEVGYSLIDEADVLPKKKMSTAFIKIVGRNRKKLPKGAPNCLDMVSTPEGFNFLYDFFVKKASPSKRMIKAKTTDNPFLPDSFIDTLMENYTEEQLDAYLAGEFVNLTAGTVYHKFDRQKHHTDREIKKGERLHVGMDFNITKMSAVIHVTEGKKIIAVDEVTGAYDTPDMIRILKERFAGHKIVVYPDASGNSRNTAGDSDISLLKKAKFIVRVDKKNPSVRDRITSVNAGFENAKGETNYYVNTNNCVEYTEALEKLPYKNGVPDKESGFDHVTDGGGYCYFQLAKVKKTTSIRA